MSEAQGYEYHVEKWKTNNHYFKLVLDMNSNAPKLKLKFISEQNLFSSKAPYAVCTRSPTGFNNYKIRYRLRSIIESDGKLKSVPINFSDLIDTNDWVFDKDFITVSMWTPDITNEIFVRDPHKNYRTIRLADTRHPYFLSQYFNCIIEYTKYGSLMEFDLEKSKEECTQLQGELTRLKEINRAYMDEKKELLNQIKEQSDDLRKIRKYSKWISKLSNDN
ncbi:MAG: hypothetical protein RIC80_02030 [Cyclobacteriaceae bacterium]